MIGLCSEPAARVPGLHERARGAEQEEGKANGCGEQAKDATRRVVPGDGAPMLSGRDGQEQNADQQQRNVQDRLPPRGKPATGEMGIEIAEEKSALKKDEANRPDCRRSAEPGEDHLGDHWLDEKKQERAEENRQRIENGGSAIALALYRQSRRGGGLRWGGRRAHGQSIHWLR